MTRVELLSLCRAAIAADDAVEAMKAGKVITPGWARQGLFGDRDKAARALCEGAIESRIELFRKIVELFGAPSTKPVEDTRAWCWRENDSDVICHGPYATREEALKDVRGYYALGELPERIFLGRVTPPLDLVTLDLDDCVETLELALSDLCMGDMRVGVVNRQKAQEALSAWVDEYLVCDEPQWMAADEVEVFLDENEEKP